MKLKRVSLFTCFAFTAAVSASCSQSLTESATADGTPDSQTDSTSYTLRSTSPWHQTTIGVTFTNRTNRAANFVNCNGGTGVQLEKLIHGTWTPAWAPIQAACLSPPIVVATGTKFQTTIHVFAGDVGSNFYPQFSVADVPGIYRVVWTEVVANYTTEGQSFGDLLPLEHRTSNTFTLAVEPRP